MQNENKYNHTCIICNKGFNICNNCVKINSIEEYEEFNINEYCKKHNINEENKQKMFLGFRSTCCEFLHYLVFDIIRKFKKNEITPYQAKIELEQFGFTINKIQEFKESVKNYLLENIYNVAENIQKIKAEDNIQQEENEEIEKYEVKKELKSKSTHRRKRD